MKKILLMIFSVTAMSFSIHAKTVDHTLCESNHLSDIKGVVYDLFSTGPKAYPYPAAYLDASKVVEDTIINECNKNEDSFRIIKVARDNCEESCKASANNIFSSILSKGSRKGLYMECTVICDAAGLSLKYYIMGAGTKN